MAAPRHSSPIGVSGNAAVAVSKSTKRGSFSARKAAPPSLCPSTTKQRWTRGHWASAATATGNLTMEVTNNCASLLLMM